MGQEPADGRGSCLIGFRHITDRLEKFLELLSVEIAVAQDFGEQPRADRLARMHRNNGGSAVSVPKKMVASLDPKCQVPDD